MLDYIYGHDEIVARFVAQLIPSVRERGFPKNITTMGVIDREGKLLFGVVYHNWEPEAERIELSGAALPGVRWLNRETLWRIYSYPFLGLKCQMVVMCVPASNRSLLRQLKALNYAFISFPRMYGRDKDGVICRLTVEEWAANKFNRPRDYMDKELAEAAE